MNTAKRPLPLFYLILFTLLSLTFVSTTHAGGNLTNGTDNSTIIAQVQAVLSGYEGEANDGNFPALLEYFSDEVTIVPQTSPALLGKQGVLDGFTIVGTNLADAGYLPGDWKIRHTIESVTKADGNIYARLILIIETTDGYDTVIDKFNCTFEFQKRDKVNNPGPTPYVVGYIQFASVNVESAAFGTVAAP